MPLLELRIRRKAQPRAGGPALEVLRDVALDFPPGSVTALLGPSGCGKTTLLRILTGLDTAFEGEVRHRPRRIGMVFQEPRLLPWRSLAENLRIVAAAAGLPPPPVEALLARVGLEGWAPRLPGELSLGMARRAALARALAVRPELLVLDEPFASLDAANAVRMRAVIAAVLAEGATTAVLVTHAVEDAAALAGRVAMLTPRPATLSALVAVPEAARREPAVLQSALAG
ncbi:ABC transporter ATP-binding protein [Teichococcus vastitatis]|jgi:NitT/TauT family transport system ATP-binding protein|uniref:ATP-binding cassette domain-containing protein n=1 Tax=Teichococcus vastitatis TaxID=2307076 RepID=A0ABS9W7T1_9PROT|nr:ATP-binding cassette domain-containing protein [Pseudoroseomonas vastitatis]MCI0755360.1 ATP-binding cassette domain-containing protein [Pseudoroseomonas vastitatis]